MNRRGRDEETSSIILLMALLVLSACTFATLKAEKLCKASLQQESPSYPYYHSRLKSSSCCPLSPAVDATANATIGAADTAG